MIVKMTSGKNGFLLCVGSSSSIAAAHQEVCKNPSRLGLEGLGGFNNILGVTAGKIIIPASY